MEITAAMIKPLREATGAGVLDCRKALEACEGDAEKAKAWLKDKGLAAAAKKSDRVAADGLVGSYIHHNHRIAVLVEVNCETDFVAANPRYVKPEDVPAAVLEEAKQGFQAEAQAAGKSGAEVDEAVEQKLGKFYQETCLVKQPYVLNEKVTIGDMLTQGITDLKENIVVRRFVRYELGA
jgi:elongation factor Ts